jgi:hypothetical protein
MPKAAAILEILPLCVLRSHWRTGLTLTLLMFVPIERKESDMNGKIFLYAEIQVAIPFGEIDWRSINEAMRKEPGLKNKTWLSGINTNTVGGFYEFDSLEHARAYATGYLAAAG